VPDSPLSALPFRLSRPGWDSLGLSGIESVSHRADGLLRVTAEGVRLEWAEVQTVERLSLERVGTTVVELTPEWLELPFACIAGAWTTGGWWAPRLELRARELAHFDGVPGARGVTLPLRIHRRDRVLAVAIATEITRRVG
jgi:hypothetical protein